MVDKLAGRSGWGGGIRRIGHIAQQREVTLQLLGELLTGQRTLAGGQQRRTAQVHGVGRAGVVDAHHQVSGDVIHRRRQPGGADRFDRVNRFPPLRHMVVQVGHQRQRFAEVNVALAKVAQLA